MDDALGVRRLERIGHLARDRQRVVQRQRPAFEALGQRGSLDELQDEPQDAFALLESVDGGDVRMIQGGENLSFAPEPRTRSGS